VDYWAVELRSEQLAAGHAVLGDGIDALATSLDEVGGAQGARVSCNLDQRTVKAHFFVRAEGFARALDEGLVILERAVEHAELAPGSPTRMEWVPRAGADALTLERGDHFRRHNDPRTVPGRTGTSRSEETAVAITASQARKILFPLIEQVNDDRQPIEITSKRGDAVLLSRADYDALTETAWLLRVPANARRLLEGLAQARAGEREAHDLR